MKKKLPYHSMSQWPDVFFDVVPKYLWRKVYIYRSIFTDLHASASHARTYVHEYYSSRYENSSGGYDFRDFRHHRNAYRVREQWLSFEINKKKSRDNTFYFFKYFFKFLTLPQFFLTITHVGINWSIKLLYYYYYEQQEVLAGSQR